MLTLKSTFKSLVKLGYTSHYKHFFSFLEIIQLSELKGFIYITIVFVHPRAPAPV